MFSTLTKFLILLLTLLQLVAPLVHAHTHGETSPKGYHLPGLEHYSEILDSAVFHSLQTPCADESPIISIGAGIKHKKVFTNNVDSFYLPAENFFYQSDINYTPTYPVDYQQQMAISAVRYILFPSRAPPF